MITDTTFEMHADIQKFQQELKAFSAAQLSAIEQTRSLARNNIQQKKDLKMQLQNKEALLKHQLIDKNQALKSILATVSKLEKQKRELNGILEDLPSNLEAIQKQQKATLSAIKHMEKSTKTVMSEKSTESERLRSMCKLYSERLGLNIVQVPGGVVQFEFSHIDAKKPTDVYSFQIKLNQRKRYLVPSCVPKLPNLDALVKELNEKDKAKAPGLFGWFVQKMRREFCKLPTRLEEEAQEATVSYIS